MEIPAILIFGVKLPNNNSYVLRLLSILSNH